VCTWNCHWSVCQATWKTPYFCIYFIYFPMGYAKLVDHRFWKFCVRTLWFKKSKLQKKINTRCIFHNCQIY
jgi:hypothetical protein